MTDHIHCCPHAVKVRIFSSDMGKFGKDWALSHIAGEHSSQIWGTAPIIGYIWGKMSPYVALQPSRPKYSFFKQCTYCLLRLLDFPIELVNPIDWHRHWNCILLDGKDTRLLGH